MEDNSRSKGRGKDSKTTEDIREPDRRAGSKEHTDKSTVWTKALRHRTKTLEFQDLFLFLTNQIDLCEYLFKK